MAPKVVVLVLAFMAVVALACAARPETTIAPVSPAARAEAPDSTIGAIDEGSAAPSANDNVEAGSIGGPVPAGVFSSSQDDAPASAPSGSGAAALEVSAAVGVVAAVAGFFF